ncbi:hypothetical protein IPH25_00620 [bacterium]|nr:MAG: hypothetical protein IPG37_02740 [bacterium]QQR61934.1 MAG: hypothetical protein IPH25_00620 [bacterium]QQR62475.1 MAG: hypothetical protein IPH67_03560 [bacterium]
MLKELAYSWKEAVLLARADTLKLVLYSSYKTIKATYKNVLIYLWLPYLLALSVHFQQLNGHLQSPSAVFMIAFCDFLLLFLTVLLVRPSVERKNYAYLFSKTKSCFVPFVLLTFIFFHPFFTQLLGWFAPLFKLIAIIALFFMTDSDGRWSELYRSVARAVKMSLYNLPIVLVGLIFYLLLLQKNTWIIIISPLIIVLWLLPALGMFLLFTIFFLSEFVHFLARIFSFAWIFDFAFWDKLKLPIVDFAFYVFLGGMKDIYYFVSYIHALFSYWSAIFAILFLPLLISCIGVFYIKRVHDQCDLYFGKEWK